MGEAYSFADLVLPHRSDLIAYAVRLTRSMSVAEDLVQDALLKALRVWAGFRPPDGVEEATAVRAWLFTVTYTVFCSGWRSRQRHRESVERYAAEIGPAVDPRNEPVAGYSDEVVDAIAQLDPAHRKILSLCAEGRSYKSIAEELGVPIGTVMSRLYRARKAAMALLSGFAATHYGLRGKRARVDVPRSEPIEAVEPDADTVDGVMGGLDGEELDLGEALADAESAG